MTEHTQSPSSLWRAPNTYDLMDGCFKQLCLLYKSFPFLKLMYFIFILQDPTQTLPLSSSHPKKTFLTTPISSSNLVVLFFFFCSQHPYLFYSNNGLQHVNTYSFVCLFVQLLSFYWSLILESKLYRTSIRMFALSTSLPRLCARHKNSIH